MSDIIFGTDGWRASIAEDYTFDNVRRCAQGFADYLKATYPGQLARGAVIGGDKRFRSEDFAAAAAEVLAANSIPVHFCGGGVPTPVISFGVTERNALGAINITASHNPPQDNGFKVRDPNGGAIDPAGLKAIEAQIPATVAGVAAYGLRRCGAGRADSPLRSRADLRCPHPLAGGCGGDQGRRVHGVGG